MNAKQIGMLAECVETAIREHPEAKEDYGRIGVTPEWETKLNMLITANTALPNPEDLEEPLQERQLLEELIEYFTPRQY